MNDLLTKIDQLQEERQSLRSQLEALKIESSEIYNKQSKFHSELYYLKNLKKKEQSKNHKTLISNLNEELQIFNGSEFVQNNALQLQETRTRLNRCEDELRKYQDEMLAYCKTSY
jgi:prefoldin subunit 5